MKISISNLAWGDTPLIDVIPKIRATGIEGIEIAPTAIWPDLSTISLKEVTKVRRFLNDEGILVSGIQSLFFGHPEYQLFDSSSWSSMLEHLERMITIGNALGANVAVFGSPRNRIKGDLSDSQANHQAQKFFIEVDKILVDYEMVLTLEPNAPAYGADFLINYKEVVRLSKVVDSIRIAPQIDTGCLWMVGVDPTESFLEYLPHHVHLSTPNLGVVPGTYDFKNFLNALHYSSYQGWVVIEMIEESIEKYPSIIESINWLKSEVNLESKNG